MRDDMITLIIDSHYIGHQARFTMGELSHGGSSTGVIYGFLSRILHLGLSFDTNDILFCWDSQHSFRKRRFPWYKTRNYSLKEKRAISETLTQLQRLRREILPMIGFRNQFIQPGCESDDLIAKIVFSKLGDFVIVSSDEDLYQCLQSNVRIYQPQKQKMMTRKRFAEEFGIEPLDWIKVKQLAGCVSDTIPGIMGVGNKTAIKYILGTLGKKTKAYQAIKAGWNKIVKRNRCLVKLPISKTKEPEISTNVFNIGGLIEISEELGFDSFLTEEKLNEWRDLFEIHTRERPPPRYHKEKARKP